jgi:hypothetical protein
LWAAKLAAQKTRKSLETTWQERTGPLNKAQWRVGHAVSARAFACFLAKLVVKNFFLSEILSDLSGREGELTSVLW